MTPHKKWSRPVQRLNCTCSVGCLRWAGLKCILLCAGISCYQAAIISIHCSMLVSKLLSIFRHIRPHYKISKQFFPNKVHPENNFQYCIKIILFSFLKKVVSIKLNKDYMFIKTSLEIFQLLSLVMVKQ